NARVPATIKKVLGAAAAAAHATSGHIIHVVVVIGVRPVGRLQRLREGAEELVAQLHGRDLEGILERPVIIWRVTALAGPEEKRDQLHLDRRPESRVALRGTLGAGLGVALFLSLSLDGGSWEWRHAALGGAHAPRRAGRRRAHRGRLGHQA